MLLPEWALRKAAKDDRLAVKKAKQMMSARIDFRDKPALARWMQYNGWKRSWIFPQESFFKALFANDENFNLALEEEIVEIWIPKKNHTLSEEELTQIDLDYTERSWSSVVAALRDIRRAIEVNVKIEVDQKKLSSVGAFYNWAHQRYPLLEEAADQWIGDDK